MKEKSFEEKISRLEEITKVLENGDCSLEDAIKLYDEAKAIAKECAETIENAKQKIEVVE